MWREKFQRMISMSKGKRYAEDSRILKPEGERAWGLNFVMMIVSALLFTWAIASAFRDGNWFLWLFSGVFGLLTLLFFIMMTTGDTR